MTDYNRVLPRDAFNESLLLKCIARITLLIEDGELKNFTYLYNGRSFDIQQDNSDGALYVHNFRLHYKGLHLMHYSPLNNKSRYPMHVIYNFEDYKLFDESGNINKIFKES